jgi:uroporphyrinogen-III synthase
MAFRGTSVLSFESRRAVEIAELIRLNGGVPFVAPALMEAPLTDNQAAFDFAAALYAGRFDMVILLTGVGTRYLNQLLSTRDPEERFPEALHKVAVVVRGPKPAAVLREWKVPITVSVPEPNTWRELLQAVEGRPETSVAVQEYGRSNPELLSGLRAQGREVTAVPVYQWKMPADTQPLAEALEGVLAGRFNVVLFTTGVQIDNFLEFADRSGQRAGASAALERSFIASIGPDCTEALQSHGINPDLQPSHPKMGILVREAAQAYAAQRPNG